VKLVLALTATCLIAEISYRFLERPFLRLKDRFDL
jgi:peptidoglycan/LPS O-acetylase OafA/YrhL